MSDQHNHDVQMMTLQKNSYSPPVQKVSNTGKLCVTWDPSTNTLLITDGDNLRLNIEQKATTNSGAPEWIVSGFYLKSVYPSMDAIHTILDAHLGPDPTRQ
jgi:hypothetical protein